MNHDDIEVGMRVYYVAPHMKNRPLAECPQGIVTSITLTWVFVRFNGPGGEACAASHLVPVTR